MTLLQVTVLLFPVWAEKLDHSILAAGHPARLLDTEVLPLPVLQPYLHVGLQSPQAAERGGPKPSQGPIKWHGVLPVPITNQLPVIQVSFENNQVSSLQCCIKVGSVCCHVTVLVGQRPEWVVVIGPHSLPHQALPLCATLGHPLVIGCKSLANGPLEVMSSDIGDKPRDRFTMETDLAC